MKRISILILLITITLGLHAQTASEIIEKLSAKIKSYQSIQLDFDYTMLNNDMGIDESNKGTLLFKSNKYVLNLSQLGLSIYCDGTNSYTYNWEANELTIANLENGDQLMNPASLLSMYEQGFDGKYVGETEVDGAKCYQLEMTPQKGNQVEFSKAEIYVDKNTHFIRHAKMYVEGGTSYSLKVKNLKTNVPIEDAAFTFNQSAHPGIEVIDLR